MIVPEDIAAAVLASGRTIPIGGSYIDFSGLILDGFLVGNGALLLVVDYPELYSVYGNMYGESTPGVDFNLPDTRGQFPRFQAEGSANDPNRTTRTDRGDGTTGDEIGTNQSYEIQSHNHTVTARSGFGFGGVLRSNTVVSYNINTGNKGGSETRPINIYCRLLIKAF